MTFKILLLPGDGVGPEVIAQAQKVIKAINSKFTTNIECEFADIGGCAIENSGVSLPQTTIDLAKKSHSILMGAVGGPNWDKLPLAQRPEKGLLQLREEFELFANLRPALLYPQLLYASTLKQHVVEGLDIVIIRELTGGIYFGKPRGIENNSNNKRAYNTMVYTESEIRRIAKVGFEIAQTRNNRLCSVDKANVLEVSQLWREVVEDLSASYPDVELSHMYVDNAAMQLVRDPKQFDVMVTSNLFGDILSDCAAMLTGSIGMLPSASLNSEKFGLFEPVHGSAPDIAGNNSVNPIATILSLAMLLRYSMGNSDAAWAIENAIEGVLNQNYRTPDISSVGMDIIGTEKMGNLIAGEI